MTKTIKENKFRAWLPNARRSNWSGDNPPDRRKKGRMIEFEPLYFMISRDSLEHPQIFTDTTEHFYGEDIEASEKGAILMQYTGLKDKNGVEIYEGDMVKGTHPVHRIANVIYQAPRFALKSEGQYGDFVVNDEYSNGKPCESIEVVGNIYENPELATAALSPQPRPRKRKGSDAIPTQSKDSEEK